MTIQITLQHGNLNSADQQIITAGFVHHSNACNAPAYKKERINWLAYNDSSQLIGALTADLLWDWIYINELWIDEGERGQGLGKRLMEQAESYAKAGNLSGLWLWTQSWQAAGFYETLGYQEFARFPEFPKGHVRIGFRKSITG